MKSLLVLLAVPVLALTGCSTYVGDAGPGPGYYDNGPYAYDDGYYGGPAVDVGVGYYGYDRGNYSYRHDYHHTDAGYRGAVASNAHTNSFHAANTRVASANVSHASSGHTSAHTASVHAGHDIREAVGDLRWPRQLVVWANGRD